MTIIRVASSTVLVALFSFAATTSVVNAQDKKAPVPPAAPKPMAPAAAAPAPAAAAAAAPVAKSAVAPAPSKAAAPMAPPPAAAAAAQPAGPPMPAPAKELDAFMKGFEGSWKCDTKFAAGAMGPGSPEMTGKSTVKFKKEFGGFSWHGEYSLAKSKTVPAMSGVLQLGYDSGSNQVTMVGYDSMGGAVFGAGPISGDSAVINEDGYMAGMKVKMRETMVKKGPKEVFHKYEADMGKGFQTMGEDTCKK